MSATPHELRLRVRYGETDQMGVVHHANYLAYFEEGRTRMMAALGCSYAALERRGVGLPVRRVELRYRAPAHYEEELLVRTRVTALRAASVTFEYELVRAEGGELVATGLTELACIDMTTTPRRVLPLPDELRELLAP
ncbi:MAG: acyl-CoA thioesterase [Planctomycetes bacterium]|nr:acyl-CoA thioesterase [Planctomycetota bacterium]